MNAAPSGRERLLSRPRNLDFLLRRRTEFLRRHLRPGDRVLEVGAGLGIVGAYVDGLELTSTDIERAPWLDAVADAAKLPFDSGAFDAVVCLHVLHHLERPRRAIEEFIRVLRPDGLLLIAEPHASAVLRFVLAATGHEYIDARVDPFGPGNCQTRGRAGNGNNIVADLLFRDPARFREVFPELSLVHHRLVECVTFLNSGGVGYQALYLPLPRALLAAVGRLDDWLASFEAIFPMSRELVFRKR
jgi:SAM-dependent methyltransferase